jgi:hypothetical protein
MKGRNLKIQTSPKRVNRSQTLTFDSHSAVTPKENLRGHVGNFLQELTLQIETLEDALRAEQQLKQKYESGLRQ